MQVLITDDVNLRSIVTGEGIMTVPNPSELPKKRKDFLPKMFPYLPEDSAVSSLRQHCCLLDSHSSLMATAVQKCCPYACRPKLYRRNRTLTRVSDCQRASSLPS